MKPHGYQIKDGTVTIYQVETEHDLKEFDRFVHDNPVMACDSETTGLDIYSQDFRVRMVQFGNAHTSYVIPVEYGGQFVEATKSALASAQTLIFHNGVFDLQVFDRALDVPMEKLWPRVVDTRILAHLVDSRGEREGGVGHSLEAQTRGTLGLPDVADSVKGLMKHLAESHKERTGVKATRNTIWSLIELDHPDYVLYAGMDTILAFRLREVLDPLVPSSAKRKGLVKFEHEIAEVCSYMERTGFLLDVDYARNLSQYLLDQENINSDIASSLGIESVNSTEQVADALEALGVRLDGRTPSGKRKVDSTVLESLLEHEHDQVRAIAYSVTEAKKARKWRRTWVDAFLANIDNDGRCHANINSLRARTARMSITGIPAQTLPSSDWMIRRCFIAEPGHRIASVDYQNQELRVLAYLAGEKRMIQAFKHGESIHETTAAALGVPKKVGKMANFLKVFGGGPAALSKQAGIPYPQAKKALNDFDVAYPGVKRFQDKITREVESKGYVTTMTGRRLHVDADRSYSGLNYLIQSTARDVTCNGIVNLHRNGATEYLRLPIHDENVFSFPEPTAERQAKLAGEYMAVTFGDVHIGTDPEVGGTSWGSLYTDDGGDPEVSNL